MNYRWHIVTAFLLLGLGSCVEKRYATASKGAFLEDVKIDLECIGSILKDKGEGELPQTYKGLAQYLTEDPSSYVGLYGPRREHRFIYTPDRPVILTSVECYEDRNGIIHRAALTKNYKVITSQER